MLIASNLTVSVDCVLKSTRSGQTLWKYKGTVIVDLSGGNTGGGLGGLIVKAVVAAVKTATADYVPYARQANYQALKTMPAGKYSAETGKDQGAEFVDRSRSRNRKSRGRSKNRETHRSKKRKPSKSALNLNRPLCNRAGFLFYSTTTQIISKVRKIPIAVLAKPYII